MSAGNERVAVRYIPDPEEDGKYRLEWGKDGTLPNLRLEVAEKLYYGRIEALRKAGEKVEDKENGKGRVAVYVQG